MNLNMFMGAIAALCLVASTAEAKKIEGNGELETRSIEVKDFPTYEWKEMGSVFPLVDEKFPKSFITHAAKDIFCGGQGDALMKILKEKGVYCEEFHSTKFMDNHCFSLNWTGKAAKENNRRTEEFMKKFAEGKL